MKKLSAITFAGILAVVGISAASAQIASTDYVDQGLDTKVDVDSIVQALASIDDANKTNAVAANVAKELDKEIGDLGSAVGTPQQGTDPATGLFAEIDGIKSDASTLADRVTVNEGNITTLKTSVGTPQQGETPSTGLYAAIDNLTSDNGDLAGRVTTAEGNITTLQTNVGTRQEGANPATGLYAEMDTIRDDMVVKPTTACPSGKKCALIWNGETSAFEYEVIDYGTTTPVQE